MTGQFDRESDSAITISPSRTDTNGELRGERGSKGRQSSAEQRSRSLTTPTRSGQSVALVSPPQWLEEWRLENGPPPATIPQIESLISAAKEALKPASVQAVAVMLETTLELYAPLPKNWDQIAEFYLEQLEDLPLDLVSESLRHLRQTHRSHWRFPNPADLRAPIREELERRRHLVRRANTALIVTSRRQPQARRPGKLYGDLTPEQRAEFDERLRAVKAALAPDLGASQPEEHVQ